MNTEAVQYACLHGAGCQRGTRKRGQGCGSRSIWQQSEAKGRGWGVPACRGAGVCMLLCGGLAMRLTVCVHARECAQRQFEAAIVPEGALLPLSRFT